MQQSVIIDDKLSGVLSSPVKYIDAKGNIVSVIEMTLKQFCGSRPADVGSDGDSPGFNVYLNGNTTWYDPDAFNVMFKEINIV